jgi:hypothetical protein
MISQVRRMTAEPNDAAPYTDAVLTSIIEQYPLIDSLGEEPFTTEGDPNPDWTPTYDLSAAAAQVWSEKAGILAGGFDFSTADQSFKRSQAYQQAIAQARYWQARRALKTIHARPHPKPNLDSNDLSN